MQDVLEAIAEPRRREILRLVHGEELPAGAIAAHFAEGTRPRISQHLRVLRQAGVLDERRDGARRLYSVRPEALGDLREFVSSFWDDRLQVLRREAKTEQRGPPGERKRARRP